MIQAAKVTYLFLNKLFENETFQQYYVMRYADLSNTVFQCDNMHGFLDSLINLIEPEMPAQINKWGGNLAGWQAEVQELHDFIDDRCAQITTGMVDCYDLVGPFEVTFLVDPPGAGDIKTNSVWLQNYPWTGTFYGDLNTLLEARSNTGFAFGWWEFNNNPILPTVNDSVAFTDFQMPDTIIAHFIPDIKYDVVVMVEPQFSATVQLGPNYLSTLPALLTVPGETPLDLQVFPEQYFDFKYWEIKNNVLDPNDTTLSEAQITFYAPDTIIAHLEPETYAYYVPNAFTPNGDGINDLWYPLGNAIDLESYEVKVFNRWGEIVFEADDPFTPWNGSNQNDGDQPLPDGVYAYRIMVKDAIAREKHELYGHVTMFH